MFRKHVRRKHPGDQLNALQQDQLQGCSSSNTDELNTNTEYQELKCNRVPEKWDDALFLLRLQCELSLTYEGVNKLAQAVQDYTETVCENAAKRYYTKK